jgi:hypothetical protein
VAFKSYASRKHWYSNAAEIEVAIQKRILRTKSGKAPLRYFDGATMASYQAPSRTIENLFCRRQPTPFGCKDDEFNFDPELPNVPISSLEVKISEVGDIAGRGVFTKVDIPKGTYISAETASQSLRFFPSTHALIIELLQDCKEQAEAMEVIEYYMYGLSCFPRHAACNLSHSFSSINLYRHGYGFTSRRLVSYRVPVCEFVMSATIYAFISHFLYRVTQKSLLIQVLSHL